jgi:uncharacterized protein
MEQFAIAQGLFTWPTAEPRLVGSRCGECEAYVFPAQANCPRCTKTNMEPTELSRAGRVWTWTSQEFLPKAPPYAGSETPETFEPYYVGYVELDGQLHVEARLVGFDEGPPYIGQNVELVVVPFRVDEEGNRVMTYAFAPIEESSDE